MWNAFLKHPSRLETSRTQLTCSNVGPSIVQGDLYLSGQWQHLFNGIEWTPYVRHLGERNEKTGLDLLPELSLGKVTLESRFTVEWRQALRMLSGSVLGRSPGEWSQTERGAMKFDLCQLSRKKAISAVQPREDENTDQGKGSPDREENYTGSFSPRVSRQEY